MPSSKPSPPNRIEPRLSIALPDRLIELDAAHEALPLPQGPDGDAPLLFYGPYLQGLSDFLSRDRYQALAESYARCFGKPLSIEHVRGVAIISEKHGACYNVARVCLQLSNMECSFAVNTAATELQKAVMSREVRALKELETMLRQGLVPRALFEGVAHHAAQGEPALHLSLFIAEWFEDFHEFHLSARTEGTTDIVVWDGKRGHYSLNAAQGMQVYRKAARLLTLCYDWDTGRQVYPWHHAAGDFVVGFDSDAVTVRLITVRDYRRLIRGEGENRDPLLDLVHFLLNLTLRMRLDRLDGTGELAWATPPCLDACLAGFLDGCSEKHATMSSFPDAPEILQFLRGFEEPDLHELLEVVAPDGLIEPDEELFLGLHLDEHAHQLTEALRRAGPQAFGARDSLS